MRPPSPVALSTPTVRRSPAVRRPVAAASLVPPLPRDLQVEVTAACNLRCRMCLVRYRPPVDRVSGTMSFDDFRALIDEVPELETVTLQGLGEPLLVPHLVDMVAYAAGRGAKVGFNTNGTILTPDKAERLVDAGLAWLHISVDGATEATYESIRDGSSFERVRRGVAAIVGARRRAGSDGPEIQIVFVAMRRNHRELPDVVRLVADWGVERLRVQNLSHSFSDTGDGDASFGAIRRFTEAEALWQGRDGEVEQSFARARELAAELGVDLRLPELEEHPPRRAPGEPGCGWPWESAYVTHDGAVQPCCMVMGEERVVLGRLGEEGFSGLWGAAPYREFRRALLHGDPPDVCRGCSLYRGVF